MGRSDDCFKSSGQWVSPVEVEGVLLRHPGVARAAVVEDFDADGLPCPCAFVVKQEVESDSATTGDRNCANSRRKSLPRFKQPRRYVFVDGVALHGNGQDSAIQVAAAKGSPS